jgi:hypothetical protein
MLHLIAGLTVCCVTWLLPVTLDFQGRPVLAVWLGVTVLQPQLSDCVVGAVAGLHLLSLSFCPGF